MKLEKLPYDLTVCKVRSLADIDFTAGFFFIGRTDAELSLVCRTMDAPENAVAREDGWVAFRIQGILDFSLVGVLSRLSSILSASGIGIFVVSTFDTDYILVKAVDFERAKAALESEGYAWITEE